MDAPVASHPGQNKNTTINATTGGIIFAVHPINRFRLSLGVEGGEGGTNGATLLRALANVGIDVFDASRTKE